MCPYTPSYPHHSVTYSQPFRPSTPRHSDIDEIEPSSDEMEMVFALEVAGLVSALEPPHFSIELHTPSLRLPVANMSTT